MKVLVLTVATAAIVFARVPPASAQEGRGPASSRPTLAPPAVTAFLGSVPSGPPTDAVLSLSLLSAVNRALEHNLGVLTAAQGVSHATGTRWVSMSHLLPSVNARVGETRQQTNLQAFGFSGGPNSPFAGIPTVIGPFNVFDARAYVSQSLLDFGALNTARADAHHLEAARYTYRGARDYVVWVAGALYLNALATAARADATDAQQKTAQALYTQAVDLKEGGIVAGIDVLRAEVALSTQTQRATAAANDAEKARLQVARAIGLPLGQRFTLDGALPELPSPDITFDQAVERAYTTRADFRAAQERVRAAEAARQSVIGEELPSVRVNADYGAIGLSPTDAHGTFSVSGTVQIPIFQGGRTRGRLLEADADLRNRRAELEDMKASIYYDVRTDFLDLQSTAQQLQVAARARDLAARQLEQSRDRFAAGVANNIEVVQAQESVALATEQYISARYGHDLAKAALVRGLGAAEQTLRQMLGGSH